MRRRTLTRLPSASMASSKLAHSCTSHHLLHRPSLAPTLLHRTQARSLSTPSRRASGQFSRSDFQGQPFTGSYEPGQPTRGPLADASPHGAPRITPKRMKEYLDKFVVGQEAAKKRLCVAVYNHYQRTRELRRREEEMLERERERVRGQLAYEKYTRNSHPTENEYPGQVSTVEHLGPRVEERREGIINAGLGEEEESAVTIEKSNIMVLGPTGVGKTLMIKLLARFLQVPFSMSDCTPLTQAGYVGDDAEVCVHRLFAESGNNVSETEHGIIYLDEVDKIAMSKTLNGKDVSGEGVQQALLKLIEGTTLHITPKTERNPQRFSNIPNYNASSQTTSVGSSQKGETYTVRTDNILFIFSGAFVGLQKIILDRLSRGSIGFGANIRSTSNSANPLSLPASDAQLFRKRPLVAATSSNPNDASKAAEEQTYNPLDLATPADFQKFGLIPEFIGRIPVATALSALTLSELIRILTEPRNSLVAQYTALFSFENIDLAFSSGALHEIASEALKLGTGARALRSIMEEVLASVMYDAFGGSVRYVLVSRKAARWEEGCGFWGRGMGGRFRDACLREEEAWAEEMARREGRADVTSFEEFREKAVSGM